MEQWKMSTLTGIILIILAILFAMLTKNVSIWIILIIILGALDIALGLYRKIDKKGELEFSIKNKLCRTFHKGSKSIFFS